MKSVSLPKYFGGCSIDTINVTENVTITEICEKKPPDPSISEPRVGNASSFNISVQCKTKTVAA